MTALLLAALLLSLALRWWPAWRQMRAVRARPGKAADYASAKLRLGLAISLARTLLLLLWTRWFGKRKVVFGMPRLTKENVLFVKSLVEAGRYRAVVDRTYPLEDVVEAAKYVESWQKTGNVVLTV